MLEYLSDKEKLLSKELYKQAFNEDSESFVDYYYSEKTKDNKILVVKEDNKIAAMAQLNPYRFKVFDEEYIIDYIVAVATDIKHRRKGLMRSIIHKFLNDMYKENKPFTFLLPADRAYYEPFDFVFVNNFEKTEFNEKGKRLEETAYTEADKRELIGFINNTLSRRYDMYCIRDEENFERYLAELKSEKGYIKLYKDADKIAAYKAYWGIKKTEQRDFICNEAYADISDTKKEAYMFRIVDLKEFMRHIRLKEDGEKTFKIRVKDPIISENNGCFDWTVGSETSVLKETNPDAFATEFHIAELTSWLFGYKECDKADFCREIKTVNRVFINEVV